MTSTTHRLDSDALQVFMDRVDSRSNTSLSFYELEFLKLTTKHNFSRSQCDDILMFLRHFTNELPLRSQTITNRINSEQKEYLGFINRSCTLEYFEQKHVFTFTKPLSAIHELLRRAEESTGDPWLSSEYDASVFGEINQCEWYKDALESIQALGIDAVLMPLIWYTDSTNVDGSRRSSVKPLVLQLGLFNRRYRNSNASKALIGYFPKLVGSKRERASKHFRTEARAMYHEAWRHVLNDLESSLGNEVTFTFNGKTYFPMHFLVIADTQEAHSITLVKSSNKTTRPCRYCMVTSNAMNDLERYHALRDEEKIIEALRTSQGRRDADKQWSLHTDVECAFWKKFLYGIYASTPVDLLHVFDLGITKYVVTWTIGSLSPWGQTLFDDRFSDIPTYSDGKYYLPIFKQGITDMKLDAKDYRAIVQLVPFILTTDYRSLRMRSEVEHQNILDTYSALNAVLRTLRTRSTYSEQQLQKLTKDILNLSKLIRNAFPGSNSSDFNFVKFHLMQHIPDFIRSYGSPQNYNSETFEQAHKHFAKAPYARTNRHMDHAVHMKNRLDRQGIVARAICEEIPDDRYQPRKRQRRDSSEVLTALNKRECDLTCSEGKVFGNIDYSQLCSLLSSYVRIDLGHDRFEDYLNSNDIGIHFSATFRTDSETFTVVCHPNHKGYGPKYDDIEVLYGSSRTRKWLAEVQVFLSLPFFKKEVAVIRSYRNLGNENRLGSIRLHYEYNEDQYAVIDVENIDQKVHVVPDFTSEKDQLAYYFFNDMYC